MLHVKNSDRIFEAFLLHICKIIFNDEPDKYFIGTKIGNSIPSPGSNSITGNIEIYCSDPFKYSDVLKEFIAEPNDNGVLEVTVINDGSVSVPIDYEITHNAESGFIGVVSDKGTCSLEKLMKLIKSLMNKMKGWGHYGIL